MAVAIGFRSLTTVAHRERQEGPTKKGAGRLSSVTVMSVRWLGLTIGGQGGVPSCLLGRLPLLVRVVQGERDQAWGYKMVGASGKMEEGAGQLSHLRCESAL